MMIKIKLFSTIVLAILSIQVGFSQADETANEMIDGPIMTFENLVVEYGEIEQHSDPLRIAKFTNTGNSPLVIKNARGSCGCTVPTYPKQPIMPGETAEIEIRYDTKRLGTINKTVTITTNETSTESTVIQVKGKVLKAASEESVPKPKTGLFKPGNN